MRLRDAEDEREDEREDDEGEGKEEKKKRRRDIPDIPSGSPPDHSLFWRMQGIHSDIHGYSMFLRHLPQHN